MNQQQYSNTNYKYWLNFITELTNIILEKLIKALANAV